MGNSNFKHRVISWVLLVLSLQASQVLAGSPPNVLIFLADDLGWADVGYHGSEIETPTIDRLADEGVRLERFYTAPICSPTRAALMTGRDPLKLGIAYDQIHPWSNAGLNPSEQSLAKLFSSAGYQTGIIGKWHLGHTQEHQLPNAQGFDEFFGHLHTNTDYYGHERESGHDLQLNGESIDRNGEYLTHLQSEFAQKFIRERDTQRPFFLYIPFTAPHSPMQAPQETIDKYENLPNTRFRRVYAAMVDEMDQAMQSILATLEDEGVKDNTLVIFASDNGGFRPYGAQNEPLRGQKGTTFEGGIRVPALVHWTGRLEAGGEINEVVSVLDLFPTLASAAGIELSPEVKLDGQNVWPLLTDGKKTNREEPLFFASEIPLPGTIHLAVIDWPWKLVQIVNEEQTSARVTSMLFNLEQDPSEQNDLKSVRPEEAKRLAESIRKWRAQHPLAGTRGTLVPHPGWVPAKDWANAVQSADLLQSEWENELPFSQALIDAVGDRGVLVDEETRLELLEQEKKRTKQLNE